MRKVTMLALWVVLFRRPALRAALFLIPAIALGVTACQTPAPVNRPCGVIRDNLKTVQATTPAGQQRLDVHFERGRAAKCWG